MPHPRNKRDMTVYNGVDPGPVLPPGTSSPDRVESVVEAAGQLTDTMEKVAQGVERVAEEVSDLLPEGGKLRKAVTVVEKCFQRNSQRCSSGWGSP
ncbi:conserved hypothetical protein [Ricinus communis]|uniref:Uncharacterized protein n=1 Tax=Ricinus communis TaxID=3988 RepID=B9RJR4_RICCO|nr:conserved hypothetical protein [Ricinus communis]